MTFLFITPRLAFLHLPSHWLVTDPTVLGELEKELGMVNDFFIPDFGEPLVIMVPQTQE